MNEEMIISLHEHTFITPDDVVRFSSTIARLVTLQDMKG